MPAVARGVEILTGVWVAKIFKDGGSGVGSFGLTDDSLQKQ